MKKIYLMALAALTFMTACAAGSGEARVELAKDVPGLDTLKTLVVSYSTIDNMMTAQRMEDVKIVYDTIEVKNNSASFKLKDEGPGRYSFAVGEQNVIDFFAAPGEEVLVKVNSLEPGGYTLSGTPLLDGITELNAKTTPIEQEYVALASQGEMNVKPEQVEALVNKLENVLTDFIKANPTSTAVPYAMLNLSGEPFMEAYNNLTPEAKTSIMMPFVEAQKEQVGKLLEAEAQQNELRSGNTPAPNFTFKDLDGKDVSLSDFRGKYVVIDFWGSWCGWCIKGFPALKEAYKKYGDKLVVIGVDCKDSPEAWREGVKKYELPWINVYNDQQDGQLYKDYGIQGFPTKVIVNPEGMIVDLTVGEDPSFFDRLAEFMK